MNARLTGAFVAVAVLMVGVTAVACPTTHPVHIPQLTVAVKFPIWGTGHDLSLSSGDITTAHGDFLNGWDRDGLAREVDHCIHRDAVCDLTSNHEEETPFFHN